MAIPPPPPVGANNGGYLIISNSNGVRTHRMKFHLAPFAASTGAYTTAQGTELNVSTTAAALMGNLRAIWPPSWTLHFAALYQYQNGLPVQIPLTGSAADTPGTSASAASTFQEGYYSLNFRTTLAGRIRVFCIEPAGYAYTAAAPRTSGDPTFGGIVGYLTGANCGVVGHDGGKALSPAHLTAGLNKKLRRRAGNA